MSMTRKEYGTVRGQCFAVGDEIAYTNSYGQSFRHKLLALFVEQPGLCLFDTRGKEVAPEVVVDLSDSNTYPYVSCYQRNML